MDIAVCLIAYNRVYSLERLLASLDNAVYPCPVKLYISVDKSDDDTVEMCAEGYQWKHGEKEVILHKENLGLRKHILSCGDLLQRHDALVVLEDDIVVASGFFLYVQAAVKEFAGRMDVAGISLYSFFVNYHSCQPFIPVKENSDVFMMQNAQSWGQVWMKEQWNAFKAWYDENCDAFGPMPHLPKSICSWSNSWLKYHTRYCIENNKYFIYPYNSYTTCFSDVGEHIKITSPVFQAPLFQATDFRPNFSPTVKYDCYFENQRIYEWLGMSAEELCLDYYGDNGNQGKCRYWLSRQLLPYKVVRSFGLLLRPYELNIKYSVEGSDLFLYDTEEAAEVQIIPECRYRQFLYMYGTRFVDTKSLEKEIEGLNNMLQSKEQTIQSQHQTISSKLREMKHLRNRAIACCAAMAVVSASILLYFLVLS